MQKITSIYELFEILPEGAGDIFIGFVSKLQFFELDTLFLEAFMIRHNMQLKISVGGQVEHVSDLFRCEVVCVLSRGLVPKEEVGKDLIC